MNADKLEQSSITKLRACIDRCPHLVHDIKENDKTPSWDGEITIYKSESHEVRTLIGVARVQVKAKGLKDTSKLSSQKITYSVRVDDLRNYQNDGGSIYFVIHIYDFDCYKIYYNALLPLDISNWLKLAKNKKTISIPLFELPISDSADIEGIVLNFLNDRKKQFGTVTILPDDDMEKAIMLSQFDQFSFSVVGTSDPIDYMFRHPIYVYGDLKHTKTPLHCMQTEEISTTLPLPVSIHGKQHYSEVIITKTADDELFCFGACFKISTTSNIIVFKECGNLECRWKALNFIKELIEYKCVYIENSYFQFEKFDIENEPQFEIHYAHTTNLREALKYFGVTQQLDCSDPNEKARANAKIIVAAYKNNGIVTFDEPVKERVCCLELENLRILINITHINDLKYMLESAFCNPSTRCELRNDSEKIPCSIFLILNQHDFETVSNMDYKAFVQDLKFYPLQSIYKAKLVELLLNMLRAYDITKKLELLEACEDLAKHLQGDGDTACIFTINYLQCVKRRRNFTDAEKQLLYDSRNADSDVAIQLGIAILLENNNDVTYNYSMLSAEAKYEFLNFPIATLAKKIDHPLK